MNQRLLVLAILLGQSAYLPCHLCAQATDTTDNACTFGATYIGDNVNNLSGGRATGSSYLGMAHITMGIDLHKSGLWDGGQFYIDAANTHGATPSADLLGDMQVASNIDAGEHTYIQELWFRQSLGKWELTAGLQDMNAEFAASDNGVLYLNSSFGILPTISHNIAAPIFPLTTLGLTGKWSIFDRLTWVCALHDGTPTDFEDNPYNLNWQFNSGDGMLAVGELQLAMDVFKMPGTYKLGVFSHSHWVERNFTDDFPDSLKTNTAGLYAYIDQQIWGRGERRLDAFTQIGYCPAADCFNDIYLGAGLNYTGLFSRKGADILGIAAGYEHFAVANTSETVAELSYQYQLTGNVFVQPDLQYIINPAGTDVMLDNCLAGTLRFGISF